MFTDIADVIKIPVAIMTGIIISALVSILFYEGVSLPIVGQVINGRVANKMDAAREGYVILAEKTAVEVRLAEMQRQRDQAAQALSDYRSRLPLPRRLTRNKPKNVIGRS